jgi:hypothetical protein
MNKLALALILGCSVGLVACAGSCCGVVFKVDPTGTETVLHSF